MEETKIDPMEIMEKQLELLYEESKKETTTAEEKAVLSHAMASICKVWF